MSLKKINGFLGWDTGILLVIPSFILLACTEPEGVKSKIEINLSHTVGAEPLHLDSLMYRNKALNVFSVEELRYYLSGFKLKFKKNISPKSIDQFKYIDVRDTSEGKFTLELDGEGKLEYLEMVLGFSPENNHWDYLPSTQENINMKWPLHLGGGYHFLKLEGWVKQSQDSLLSYTVHLGASPEENLELNIRFAPDSELEINSDRTLKLNLAMDVLGWLDGPNIYNVLKAGETMTNDSLKHVLLENGAINTFSLSVAN